MTKSVSWLEPSRLDTSPKSSLQDLLREEFLRHEAAIKSAVELCLENTDLLPDVNYKLAAEKKDNAVADLQHGPSTSPRKRPTELSVCTNDTLCSDKFLRQGSPVSPTHTHPAKNLFYLPSSDDIASAHRRVTRAYSHSDPGAGNWRFRVHSMLQSNLCEYVVACLIIVNASTFGIQADFAVKYPMDNPPEVYRTVDVVFAVAFALELLLRIFASGPLFLSCTNKDLLWNLLDSFLVFFSVAEEIVTLSVEAAPDVSSARMIRLLRLFRIVRVLRVLRLFKDLRVMVSGIMSSMKPLLWALLLLALIIYIFAVCFLEFVADHLADGGPMQGLTHYNSLVRAAYTLYMSILGGVSWMEVAEPLIAINPFLGVVFSMYVAFAVLCVLNIVTGVFVEQSSMIAKEDEENMLFEEIESRKKWMQEIEKIFHQADTDNSGLLTVEELEACVTDFWVQTCFKRLGVDLNRISPTSIFSMLDFDGSGAVEISEFAAGLQQLHGSASSVDFARVVRGQRTSQKQLKKLAHIVEHCEELLASMHDAERPAVSGYGSISL